MPILTKLTNSAKPGMVLQGFFCDERFRARSVTALQAKPALSWAHKALRPELLPPRLANPAAQPKLAPTVWFGAPRPELLPGMGRSRIPALPAVAQRRANGDVTTTPVPDGMLRLAGNGKPLDNGVRVRMEDFFQADFSNVRIHEGPAAKAMGALAFTLGETVYFSPGLYDPTTRAGVELLGHELAHVIQQREGRVANPYGRSVAIVQDPGLEAEADAMGRQVAAEMWSKPHRLLQPRTIQRAVNYTGQGTGYLEFDYNDTSYHINLELVILDDGKRIYHVTEKLTKEQRKKKKRKSKSHYFFYMKNKQPTPCRPPAEFSSEGNKFMFNKLDGGVQNYVTRILQLENIV